MIVIRMAILAECIEEKVNRFIYTPHSLREELPLEHGFR
jgi:hypothetical protein